MRTNYYKRALSHTIIAGDSTSDTTVQPTDAMRKRQLDEVMEELAASKHVFFGFALRPPPIAPEIKETDDLDTIAVWYGNVTNAIAEAGYSGPDVVEKAAYYKDKELQEQYTGAKYVGTIEVTASPPTEDVVREVKKSNPVVVGLAIGGGILGGMMLRKKRA